MAACALLLTRVVFDPGGRRIVWWLRLSGIRSSLIEWSFSRLVGSGRCSSGYRGGSSKLWQIESVGFVILQTSPADLSFRGSLGGGSRGVQLVGTNGRGEDQLG